jgi:hypothetical protein
LGVKGTTVDKVKVSVKGGGSILVSGESTAKGILDFIASDLEEREMVVELVKRGRQPKPKPLSGDSEVEGGD